uniref:Uncharacterized protein n=1 Tax=Pseudictyota dubia TaxID=2749911 RepID=A0A7R9WFK0_9STRA|mmetsp:Transcript_47391/g.88004  ORF Transcript_47391/g.88004 Transcript_47391/m.88004 type:complete len:261 (+) Transcript_47391:94-876(+)
MAGGQGERTADNLFLAIERQSATDEIRELLKTCPASSLGETDSMGSPPLLRAVQCQAPLGTVLALLRECSKTGVGMTDPYGRTALHWLIEEGYPSEEILAVLNAHPQAVSMVDGFGSTPLHYIARKRLIRRTYDSSVLRKVIEADPEAIRALDGRGRTPLVLGKARGAPTEALTILSNTELLVKGTPSYQEATSIFSSFQSLEWWWGMKFVVDVHPAVLGEVENLRQKLLPHILSKEWRWNVLGVTFELVRTFGTAPCVE